ncbi:MAG: aminoglycoside phosphotransferase family protein [Acidobacteriota bacterium]|nr:aminoglycoside phosphotransferase family protein [Acidobacteriota bacterium]
MTLEADVERAAASALGAPVLGVEPLTHGDINRVYKVETPARAFVLKVFSRGDWPEEGKLPWVEARLDARAVPRARLLHYTRGGEFFPHGFSVSEYAAGANCKQAIRDGRLDAFNYLEMAGAYLRRVHEIGVPRYGYLGGGLGTEEDYVGWLVGWELKDRLDELRDAPGLGANLYAGAAGRVEKILRRYERRLRPALVHADATPKNAILTGEGRMLLVDWDEALAAPWLHDYTNLSYWYSYILRRGGLEVRDRAEVRAAFFRGYGEPEFDADELDALESALHTVQAAGVLAFYFQRGHAEGFSHTRELLRRLLDAPPP